MIEAAQRSRRIFRNADDNNLKKKRLKVRELMVRDMAKDQEMLRHNTFQMN